MPRPIEDTRQQQVEMIDPAEWWERVQDETSSDLWEFINEELARTERMLSMYMRENRMLKKRLEEIES